MGVRGTKYCSKKCRLDFEYARRRVHSVCGHCGKEFTRDVAFLRRVQRAGGVSFCSRECTAAYHVGEKSPAWRGGSDPNRGQGWLKRAEEARARDGYKCRRCGKTQEENKQRLSVDHIRPWREFEDAAEANALDNLASLCRKCHSWKTTTLEKKWLRGDYLALQEYRRWIGIMTGS